MLDGGGLTNFHFLWRSSVQMFGDKAQALQFLGRFKGNPAYMAKLRSLVAGRGAWPDLSRLSDDWVLEQAALLLVSGELMVGFQWHEPMELPQGEAQQASGPSAPPPAAERQQEEDPPTFGAVDGAAPARALRNAAQDGVPFCEECERARAAGGSQ